MKKRILGTTLVALALFLTGCPSERSYLARHSVAFQQGYKDGCKNAEEMVTNSFIEKRNDTPRYKNDPEYREGWDDGYSRCYANKEMELQMRRPGAFY